MSAILKDTLREIWRTRNRFLSIFMIVALGAGFFAGLKATCPNMLATADKYYAEHNLMDIRLVSTYGFNDNDIAAVREVEGVKGIFPSYSKDVFVHNEANANVLAKVMALPDSSSVEWGDNSIDSVVLTAGRMPQAPDECLAENRAQMSYSFSLGEQVTVSTDDPDDPLEDSLARDTWTVVGFVRSPQYISFERGATTIGNGTLDCYLMVPMENFTQEVYTEVYMTLDKDMSISSFSDEYEDTAAAGVDKFEALGDIREGERYNEIKKEADEKLADAKVELADGERDAAKELGDAEKELKDAEKDIIDAKVELADGWAEYYDGQKELADAKVDYAKEISDAEKKLEDARADLEDGWGEYYDGKKTIDDSEKELMDAYKELEKGQKEIDDALAEQGVGSVDALEDMLSSGQSQIDQGKGLLSQAQGMLANAQYVTPDQVQAMAGGLSQLDPQLGQVFGAAFVPGSGVSTAMASGALSQAEGGLDQQEAKINEGRAGLKELKKAQGQINDGMDELKAGAEKIRKGKQDLLAAYDQLLYGEEQYETGYKDYIDGKEEGAQKIADAEIDLADAIVELTDGEKEYSDGIEDYKDGYREYADGRDAANIELANGRKKLADAEDEVSKLKRPVWYVFDRNDNPGYSTFDGDAHRIEAVSQVFPVFFFLVAALVCLTTMTRMVEEQRTEIGTLKALGYSRGKIASKYLVYSTVASISGGIFGIAAGSYLFPTVIFGAYGLMYIMPEMSFAFDWPMYAMVLAACLVCTTIAVVAACNKELASQPAELMRPRSPKAGKRVLLERITFIWSRLDFIKKVTVRNLFRYKKRIFMTILGIAGCTALTLTGFGLYSSISGIMDKQYNEIFHYDLVTALDDKAEAEDTAEAIELLGAGPLVSSSTPVYQKSAKFAHIDSVSIFVMEEPEKAGDYITFKNRATQSPLELTDSGVVLTEKLSEQAGVKVGDMATFTVSGKEVSIPITGIAENYVLHFVYMTPACYEQYFGSEPVANIMLTKMTDTSDTSIDSLASELIDNKAVLALTFSRDSRENFRDVVDNLNYVVLLVIVSAALLAFIVLYNLTNINITERIREIATIKVLGFYDNEVSAYVYRENMLLTLMGGSVGLVLGIWLHKFVVNVAETDAVMFGRTLPLWCFIAAFVMTILFSLMVNWIMYFHLKKISMVESLKSVE